MEQVKTSRIQQGGYRDIRMSYCNQQMVDARCSYLDIYISQNIRLYKGDFEGQFQTTLQAKDINFLI